MAARPPVVEGGGAGSSTHPIQLYQTYRDIEVIFFTCESNIYPIVRFYSGLVEIGLSCKHDTSTLSGDKPVLRARDNHTS